MIRRDLPSAKRVWKFCALRALGEDKTILPVPNNIQREPRPILIGIAGVRAINRNLRGNV